MIHTKWPHLKSCQRYLLSGLEGFWQRVLVSWLAFILASVRVGSGGVVPCLENAQMMFIGLFQSDSQTLPRTTVLMKF